ncbi:hypothetical protein OSTOST_13320 [Ostertagia ostertagi]
MFASMGPMIESLEEQIRSTRGAQLQMNTKINEMAEFLHELNEHEGAVRYSSIMGSVHDRLSRVQRLIAREIYKKKKIIKEADVPPSPEH